MELKDRITGFYCEMQFQEEPDEKFEELMVSLVENLKVGFLKSMMLDTESNRIIYRFLKENIPIISVESKKYDFSIRIGSNYIKVDYPVGPVRSSAVLEPKELMEAFKIDDIKHIDKSLTSLISVISTEFKMPLKNSKFKMGLSFNLDKEFINNILSEISTVKIMTNCSIDTTQLQFTISKDDIESKYNLVLRKETFAIEKECPCDADVNLIDFFNALVEDASLFIKEKKINVNS